MGGGGGGGGGARGAAALLGPVELDTSSLWMDFFSLDSVILIKLTGNIVVCHFPYATSIFQRHIS